MIYSKAMKNQELLVRASCTNRKFYFERKPGNKDWQIRFTPHRWAREKLHIERVYRSTGCADIAAARQVAREIIESCWPDRNGRIAAAELAKGRNKDGGQPTLPIMESEAQPQRPRAKRRTSGKKEKTSISIRRKTLKVVKEIAKDQGRSVSNVLERYIEQKVAEAGSAKAVRLKPFAIEPSNGKTEKTSLSINRKALDMVKEVAQAEGRSVSCVLERFVEQMASEASSAERLRTRRSADR